jgi:hypothetical protein
MPADPPHQSIFATHSAVILEAKLGVAPGAPDNGSLKTDG